MLSLLGTIWRKLEEIEIKHNPNHIYSKVSPIVINTQEIVVSIGAITFTVKDFSHLC